MKSRDLRIGNWMKSELGYEMIVVDIDQFGCSLSPKRMSTLNYPTTRAEPIEITPEWLVKFGFTKYEEDGQVYHDLQVGSLEVSINGGQYALSYDKYQGVEDDKWADITYVHQLQNLCYALSGEELKIK